jgi:TonB-dependent starch-binding outer membrane protein SusC
MLKKICSDSYCPNNYLLKFLLTMKLTLLITCLTAFQLSATVYSQNSKITLNSKQGNFGEIIAAIEEQSDYKIFFKNEQVDLNRNVTVSSLNESISELLKEALLGTNMGFTLMDKIIVLAPKTTNSVLQQLTVKGKVTDESGSPLPGVNVLEKGTTNGVTTDFDGNFTLKVSSGDATIIFSFIGYTPQDIPVAGKSEILVTLQPDVKKLDEVVVIGYGVQKKKLVTGATAQVKGEELEKQNTTNALQAMQGKTPGVNITTQSGQPGEGLKVLIRGAGTIGNASPLYIVDGVQVGDIKYLNNSDIESVDVLKDAASAAIYGSQGANGVILITTKQGKSGKGQITFDAYYGYQNRAKKIDMLNARQYATIMNEEFLNSGGDKSEIPFDVNNLPQYVKIGIANTDWLNEMFQKNAVIQNYSLGISGGTEKSIYSISLGYTGQEGIVGGRSVSNYERYNARVNTEQKLYNDKIKVGEHMSFSSTKKNGISVGNQYSNTLRSAFNVSPLMPVYDDAGNYFDSANDTITDINPKSKTYGDTYWNNTEANPYGIMKLNNQNKAVTQNFLGDFYTEIEFIKNLKLKTTVGIDYAAYDYRSYNPVYELSVYSYCNSDYATQTFSKSMAWNVDNVLTYNLLFNQHKLDFMAGSAIRDYEKSEMSGTNYDLAYDDFKHAWLSNATNTSASKILSGKPDDDNDEKKLSYFGRIQYNYKETYMLNGVFRADGSSKFAKGHQWGYFPSVSAGWVISNEDFMKTSLPILNFLKLRASWGQNGNSNIPAFEYLALIAFTKANYSFGSTEGVNTNGSYPSRLSNEDVKWETSQQIDLGVDSKFFDSNLSFEFDWYKKDTKNWLVQAPVLATAGTTAPWINGGGVTNTGIEINLSYDNHFGKLNYDISANCAYNKNKVWNIPTADGIIHGATNSLYANSEEFYRAESGHSIGYFWGYKTDGIFQTTAEVNDYLTNHGKTLQSDPVPGDIRFVDTNGDGKINTNDKVDLGNPNPDYVFGFNLSMNYKALDLSVVGSGVAGNQIVQSYRDQSNKYANYTSEALNRWTGKGTSNKIPRATESNINYLFSDIYVQDGSYLRISNVTLGFDLSKILKLKYLSQCRFYAQVQNLYTFTKYDGMDPEIGYGLDNGPTDRYSSGIDLGFYPRPRTLLFGVNVKF